MQGVISQVYNFQSHQLHELAALIGSLL